MKIEEEFVVLAPIDRVWQAITDPHQVAACIPGCESVEVLGTGSYVGVIKVALGPIKASFKLQIDVTEQQPPTYIAAVTRGEEGGRLSTLTAQSSLRLTPVDDRTTNVGYQSDVSILGRLGKFGLGILKKQAKTLGAEFAASFKSRVEASLDA